MLQIFVQCWTSEKVTLTSIIFWFSRATKAAWTFRFLASSELSFFLGHNFPAELDSTPFLLFRLTGAVEVPPSPPSPPEATSPRPLARLSAPAVLLREWISSRARRSLRFSWTTCSWCRRMWKFFDSRLSMNSMRRGVLKDSDALMDAKRCS